MHHFPPVAVNGECGIFPYNTPMHMLRSLILVAGVWVLCRLNVCVELDLPFVC